MSVVPSSGATYPLNAGCPSQSCMIPRRTARVTALAEMTGISSLTATACVGTFVLAEAALLDGEIGAAVGYAEGVTLRALLRRRLGRGVREIRRSL